MFTDIGFGGWERGTRRGKRKGRREGEGGERRGGRGKEQEKGTARNKRTDSDSLNRIVGKMSGHQMQGFSFDLLVVRLRTYIMDSGLAYDDEIVYLGQSRSIC